ncbi:MAG: aldo/keto reductase [Verrucomicrobia bacterium]|jgi:aryl-alcohol dehydrogenase-like predicted oxidoreductase|nr:aldo/keto reductase [Candidatus Dechloromonas phosphoritropha]MBP7947904.1 aldo/keto reductase [Verrucomicrobiota bacterium]
MRYRLLGRSGLRVSELCLGTMTFGEDWHFGAGKDESRAIFDAYCTAGGNFLDTANAYTCGTSERLVGEFVAGERERFVISTKYSLSTNPNDSNAGGNHRKNMHQAIERSLRQLQTDYIDIYWLHVWDAITPIDEIMRGLDDLVRSGKILYAGISDAPAWVAAQANTLAEFRGWTRFIGLQAEFSLIERTAERDLLPMAAALGLGVMAWAPLGGGVLTGKYVLNDDAVHIADSKRGEWLNGERLKRRSLQIAGTLASIAAHLNRPPAQVALSWIRQQAGHLIPIVGARTASQMIENLGCLELTLDASTLAKLDNVSAISLGFPHRFLNSRPLQDALFGVKHEQLDGWHQFAGCSRDEENPGK